MQKTVLFDKEARDKILSGVVQITKAVGVTMGASGKCVLIGNAAYGSDGMVHFPTMVTKDGYNCTKHFELSDPISNRGAMLIKEAAAKTVELAGDATTCTCVLAGSMIIEGMKLIDDGNNSPDLKKGIDIALEEVVEELKGMSIPVAGDNDRIFQVATISANNDKTIGRYIADAYKQIGDNGVIDVEGTQLLNTEIKVADGFKLEKGYVSKYFVTNHPKELVEFNDGAYILLYDKRITHHTQVENILSVVAQENKPLLIICEDAAEQGLAFLITNHLRKYFTVCVVGAPGFGDSRTEAMNDIALLTGGDYVSDIHGLDIKEAGISNLGYAQKVIVSKEETIIIGGDSKKHSLEELLNNLKMNLTQAKTEDEKHSIEKRIAKLTGGVAVIKVGAATESELGEKLDRYDDAVRATKAAIQEGFVPGGGTAFLRIFNKLYKEPTNSIEKGKALLYHSLKAPFTQILTNAAVDPEPKYLEIIKSKGNVGYNVKTEKVEDMVDAGVIDATKALRCALINAASVAGVALTSECLIVTTS